MNDKGSQKREGALAGSALSHSLKQNKTKQSSDDWTTTQMCLLSLSCTFKNGSNGKSYVMYILPYTQKKCKYVEMRTKHEMF